MPVRTSKAMTPKQRPFDDRCSEWTIRTGSESDIEALLHLWCRSDNIPSVSDTPDGLRALLAHDEEFLIVAEADGRLVGSLIAAWDGWRGSFYRLAVDPEVRRRGLGTALVREGERRLRERGAIRLTANVAATEQEAVAFWRGIGYEHHDVSTRFVRVFAADSS